MRRVKDTQAKFSQVPDPMSLISGLFAVAPVGFQIFDSTENSILINEAFRQMFGLSSIDDSTISNDVLREIAGIDSIRMAFQGQTVRQPVRWYDRQDQKMHAQHKDNCHAIESTVFPILREDGIQHVCFIHRDVSAEAQIAAKVSESRVFLETAASFNKIGTWISGVEPDAPVTWSKPIFEILGLEEGVYQIKTFFDAIHPLDRETVASAIECSVQTGAPYSIEHRIIRPSGEVRWICSSGEIRQDENGKVIAMGISQDITGWREAQELQRITQARYQKLFESEVMGIFLADTNGGIFDANDAFLKILGYSREDLLSGKINWGAMTPPEYSHLDAEGVKSLQATGNCPPYRKQFIRKDGTRIPVVVGGALVQTPGTEVISFAFDLSEMTRLELQFQQSQKMEAMGRFAGGIAHDFNNILATILLMVEQGIGPNAKQLTPDKLTMIRDAAERGARLTRQILAFSRKQVSEPRNLDLNIVVSDMEAMFRQMINENIQLHVEVAPRPALIFSDQGQIEQCILNLVLNACDAMPKGGNLSVSVKVTEINSSIAHQTLSQLKAGEYVTLSVSDSGHGMTDETMAQIFEPFYTTKEKGKGTGLGLSTVFGIVRQMKGEITVKSKIGEGSHFILYLPCSTKVGLDLPTTVVPFEISSAQVENKKVLFVEDEPTLRAATAMLLRNAGFEVVEASDGQEAWELFQAAQHKFDLIVTDVITPRMSGASLIQEISKTTGLSIPVVYLSGYPAEELEKHGVRHDSSFFIEKPYTSATFLSTVMRAARLE